MPILHEVDVDTIRLEPRPPEDGPNLAPMARAQSSIAAVSKTSTKSSAKGHTCATTVSNSAAISSQILAKEAVVASGKLKMEFLAKNDEKTSQEFAPKVTELDASQWSDTPAPAPI